MKYPQLFVMEIRDVLADHENERIDSRELVDQLFALIAYHEDLD